jgi:hypothetical protein
MADEPREFEPLMIAIEKVTDAISAQARSSAIEELRALKMEFQNCCCRFARVVPYEPHTSSAPAPTKAT